jgi:hypothetical protein
MPFPNPATQFGPGNGGGPGRPKKRVIDYALESLQEYRGHLKPADVRRLRELIESLGPDFPAAPTKTVQGQRGSSDRGDR